MKQVMLAAGVVLAVASSGLMASGDAGGNRFSETLRGFKEAPAPISTTGHGAFQATISKDGSEINYMLTFDELEGEVLQAHIHIGYPQNSGGIVLWLCQSAGAVSPTPLTTPQCTGDDPSNLHGGRVSGTLTAADVRPLAANGIIGPDEWAQVVELVREGRTYANVHSKMFPGGEIRSQLDNGPSAVDGHDHGGH